MVRLSVILLVDRRGHLLLMERDEHAPIAPEQWGMVGGHVEDGEDFEPAAYRELEEETGIALPPGELELWCAEVFDYARSPGGGSYHVYTAGVSLDDSDIVVGEGRQIVFVDPRSLPAMDLAESAAWFVPRFLESDTYRRIVEGAA
ncbi:MAG TPA: NUDIX domain-containing protein [Marmoricola sp.]|nr:NUDIX domain-containing protein [Marmoricola sp.]